MNHPENILIAGNISTIALSLAKELLEKGHSAVVTDTSDDFLSIKNKNFSTYKNNSSDDVYQEIFRSHSFDTVFYISAPEDRFLDNHDPEARQPNISLEVALDLCEQTGVERFIFISSTDIYGNSGIALEDDQPEPASRSSQLLLNNENLCRFYAFNHALSVSIIRVPLIYGAQEKNSLLYELIKTAKTQEKIEINAHKLTRLSFLHIEDFLSFVSSLLENEKGPVFQVFNLNADDINFAFLAQLLKYHIPGISFSFIGKKSKILSGQKIEVKAAKENYNWKPGHQLIRDLPSLLHIDPDKQVKRKSLVEKLKSLTISYRPLLAWGEVILGAFLTHMLTIWTNTIIEFKYIDFRLLYVVIIGSRHGLLFGVLAAILAAVSGAINWYRVGLDWVLFVYNVENWIPFALFFLAGAVTGYMHDKKDNEIDFERHQAELIHDKYDFLYNLYNEIVSIKDRLRKQ